MPGLSIPLMIVLAKLSDMSIVQQLARRFTLHLMCTALFSVTQKVTYYVENIYIIL